MAESVEITYCFFKDVRQGGVAVGVEDKSWQPSHIVDLDVYKLFRGARVKLKVFAPSLKVSLECFRGIK
jgi:hypothetical protein